MLDQAHSPHTCQAAGDSRGSGSLEGAEARSQKTMAANSITLRRDVTSSVHPRCRDSSTDAGDVSAWQQSGSGSLGRGDGSDRSHSSLVTFKVTAVVVLSGQRLSGCSCWRLGAAMETLLLLLLLLLLLRCCPQTHLLHTDARAHRHPPPPPHSRSLSAGCSPCPLSVMHRAEKQPPPPLAGGKCCSLSDPNEDNQRWDPPKTKRQKLPVVHSISFSLSLITSQWACPVEEAASGNFSNYGCCCNGHPSVTARGGAAGGEGVTLEPWTDPPITSQRVWSHRQPRDLWVADISLWSIGQWHSLHLSLHKQTTYLKLKLKTSKGLRSFHLLSDSMCCTCAVQ